jgi:hypothetical protein
VDLSDGAADAPAGSEFSPVEDEFAFDWREVWHIGNFGLNRNYRISGRLQVVL